MSGLMQRHARSEAHFLINQKVVECSHMESATFSEKPITAKLVVRL